MIAELLYPKELKEIIADLRAKDDLNEKAISNLNRQVKVILLLYLIFVLMIIILEGIIGIIIVLVLSPLFAFLLHFLARNIFTKCMAPYLYGDIKEGLIINVGKRTYYGFNLTPTYIISIQNNETQNLSIIKFSQGYGDNKFWHIPKINQEITYFNTENRRYGIMPAYKNLMSIYCLSKMVLDKEKSSKNSIAKQE